MLKGTKSLIGLFPLLFVLSACTNNPSTSLEAKKKYPIPAPITLMTTPNA